MTALYVVADRFEVVGIIPYELCEYVPTPLFLGVVVVLVIVSHISMKGGRVFIEDGLFPCIDHNPSSNARLCP